MKVTLEFEESDLKEMLTGYFLGNGFLIKNLDEVCAHFSNAYPEGLKVQAEITAPEPVQSRVPSVESVEPRDSDSNDVTDTAEPTLSLNDLTDPEPRGKAVRASNTKNDFAELLNISKRIENERRRT